MLDGVELVVVADGAPHRETQPDGGGRLHAVHAVADLELLVDHAGFAGGDVAAIETQINSMGLNEEALAQSTLMKTILDSYKGRLLNEKNAALILKEKIANEEISFNEESANLKEFKVISEPQIPLQNSSPSLKKNLLIALISGLILSIALIFLQEAVRK